MSIYRFSPDSPISTIAFHYADGKPTVALIEASKTTTAEQISEARKTLSEKGISLVPVTVDERDMLQVSGFGAEQTLIDALAAKNIVKGTPEITQEKSDLPPPPKSKAKTFLENYSLRLAGGLNLIGDIMMHVGGYGKITAKTDKLGKPLGAEKRRESFVTGRNELIGGGLYTLGGLNSLAFGNSKNEEPPLANRTADFIAHTVSPQTVPLNTPKESRNFLRRHTADVTLGAYTVGAGVFLADGMRGYQALNKKLLSASAEEAVHLKLDRKKSASLMAYGASSLVFKLLSLFIKEKPKSEEEKPKSTNPIVRVKDWFVEKPLRIFGLGSFITDSLYAKYTLDTYRELKGTPNAKSTSEITLKIITTLSYFASDFLSAISSKNLLNKPLGADGERGVIALAAQSIAEQPQEKRDELISKTAQFLNDQPEIQLKGKKSIAVSLKNQLKHLSSNPWAKRVEMPDLALHKQR
jgi:hypothetical protein